MRRNGPRLAAIAMACVALSLDGCESDDASLELTGTYTLNRTISSNTCGWTNGIASQSRVVVAHGGDLVRIPDFFFDGRRHTMLVATLVGRRLDVHPFSRGGCHDGGSELSGTGSASETSIQISLVEQVNCPGQSCRVNWEFVLNRE